MYLGTHRITKTHGYKVSQLCTVTETHTSTPTLVFQASCRRRLDVEKRGKRACSWTTHPKNHPDAYSLYCYGQRSPGLMGFVVYILLQGRGLWSGWVAPTSVEEKKSIRFQRLSVLFVRDSCYDIKVLASFLSRILAQDT